MSPQVEQLINLIEQLQASARKAESQGSELIIDGALLEQAAKQAGTLRAPQQPSPDDFVSRVAGLSIWDYDQNDGTPYRECKEPTDGYLDSHTTLMDLIEEARRLETQGPEATALYQFPDQSPGI
ncbi:hypothetical protein [Pseudomonas aeruginosa]|uniref:hypothetical protein n=1 Tax=Pseudomonas aeruginosa TaxID=287 RepID=UPI0009390E69|nr:hypothetical protein [Pseudomonas aeruginosa]